MDLPERAGVNAVPIKGVIDAILINKPNHLVSDTTNSGREERGRCSEVIIGCALRLRYFPVGNKREIGGAEDQKRGTKWFTRRAGITETAITGREINPVSRDINGR